MSNVQSPITQMRGPEWINALELLCVKYLKPSMMLVEIGSFGGESTEVFSRHVKTVFAIDPWHHSYHQNVLLGCREGPLKVYVERAGLPPMSEIEGIFDRRLSGLTNVRKIKAFDRDAIIDFSDQSIDFLYIDSIHTYDYVKETVSRWWPKVRPGGIIGGHDYCPTNWAGVVAAVNETLGEPDEVFPDTSWVALNPHDRVRTSGCGGQVISDTKKNSFVADS